MPQFFDNLFGNRPAGDEAPPPLEPVQLDPTPTLIVALRSRLPGKFKLLSDFASLELPDLLTSLPDEFPPHRSFEEDPFTVSEIVHVSHSDPNSTLHDRIMLVISRNDTSLTCLGFCTQKHAISSQYSAHHARLITAGTEVGEGEQDSTYFTMGVCLEKGQPKKDVYIDMKDPWTVSRGADISFAVLGNAEPNTFKEVKWKAIEIFAESCGLDLKDYPKRTGSVIESVVEAPVEHGLPPVVLTAGNDRRHQETRRSIDRERDKRAREASSEKPSRRRRAGEERKQTTFQHFTGRRVSPLPF